MSFKPAMDALIRVIAFTTVFSTFVVFSATNQISATSPVVEFAPENTTSLVGSTVTLSCVVSGDPPPSITWLYQGKPLVTEDERFQELELGGLLITDIDETLAGKYSCAAENDAGQVTADGYLSIQATSPVVELAPENTTSLVGSAVTLSCAASGAPTPNITWLYQDKPILAENPRFQVSQSELIIINVEESDAGKYSCVAVNDNGQATEDAYLSVNDATLSPPKVQYSEGNIVAGAGYSSDKEQVVAQKCYNGAISSVSAQQAQLKIDSAMTFSELEKQLGVSVSVSGKYGMFSADASADYARSVQDKDYSLSLNYYSKYSNRVTVQIAGYGLEALTDVGKSFYDNGNNVYFGLTCGDNYIASFEQGAFLTMGINIIFSSALDKSEFNAKVGTSFGDIVSASASVKNNVKKTSIKGKVIIQALQIGGEPSQLSKVLSKDSDGQFFAVSCSLSAMDNCIKAASGLLNYARDEFPEQFSVKKNEGLTPLGIGSTTFNPAKQLGIKIPDPRATPEITKIRKELSSKLLENEYYKQKLYPFVNNGYPVKLDETFIEQAKKIYNRASRNVNLLMQPHGGASDCFNSVDECKKLKSELDSELQTITQNDLQFLDKIKYSGIYSSEGKIIRGKQSSTFYSPGKDTAWYTGIFTSKVMLKVIVSVRDIKDENHMFGFTVVYNSFGNKKVTVKFEGSVLAATSESSNNDKTFAGRLTVLASEIPTRVVPWYKLEEDITITRRISPFFFEAYKNTS